MILPFSDESFPEKILKGTKIHTIREDKHNRWQYARMINFVTGSRTKLYNEFHTDVCTGTQKISIVHISHTQKTVLIDGKVLYKGCKETATVKQLNKMEQLANNDGFATIADFFKWFNKDFTGKIIHWTDYRY